MSGPARVLPFGPRGLLVEVAGPVEVATLWRSLRTTALPGVVELVAGARTVLVVADPQRCDLSDLAAELEAWPGPDRGLPAGPDPDPEPVVIPVVYDGPDLAEVARVTGLPAAEVAARHQRSVYTVGFVGFAPGFAYLVGGDPALHVARRAEPRPAVPAGSVALAGDMTAVYPMATPGGWQLIGRTDLAMFDPTRRPPALLAPGDRVRFVAVAELGPVPTPAPAPGPTYLGGARGARAAAEVLRPGPLTTVQDAGRIGHAHEGVPRAGAADALSLASANRLVGNAEDAPGLEATLSGPSLRFRSPVRVAVAGAPAPATVDGQPAPPWPAALEAGSTLTLGTMSTGLRSYLAVAGGWTVPEVLGSRSADTLSGLGPAPLRAGDLLPVGPEPPLGSTRPGGARDGHGVGEAVADAVGDAGGYAATGPPPGGTVVVDAFPGPRSDWLAPGQLEDLEASEFTVSPLSDRTGVRLDGAALVSHRTDVLPSEGMVPGAVQLPPGGRPIVLLCNHATTGGYPAVLVVTDHGQAALAQARPGCRVRFRVLR